MSERNAKISKITEHKESSKLTDSSRSKQSGTEHGKQFEKMSKENARILQKEQQARTYADLQYRYSRNGATPEQIDRLFAVLNGEAAGLQPKTAAEKQGLTENQRFMENQIEHTLNAKTQTRPYQGQRYQLEKSEVIVINHYNLDMQKLNFIKRSINNNFKGNKGLPVYDFIQNIVNKLDNTINGEADTKNQTIIEVLDLLKKGHEKQKNPTKEAMKNFAEEIENMMQREN